MSLCQNISFGKGIDIEDTDYKLINFIRYVYRRTR
jgi:hypothetical protein